MGFLSDVTDHGSLGGLLDDDHTQYALLAGRAGASPFTGLISSDSLHVGGTSAPGDNNCIIDGELGIQTTGPNIAGRLVEIGNDYSFTYVRMNASVANQVALEWAKAGVQKWLMFIPGNSNNLVFYDGAAARVTYFSGANVGINGGLHVGGDSDPGDNNLNVDGIVYVNGKAFTFGANDSAGAGFRTVTIENA